MRKLTLILITLIITINKIYTADILEDELSDDIIPAVLHYQRTAGTIKIINNTQFPILFQYYKNNQLAIPLQQVVRAYSRDIIHSELQEIRDQQITYSTYGEYLQWTSPVWTKLSLKRCTDSAIDISINLEEAAAKKISKTIENISAINQSLNSNQESLAYQTVQALNNGAGFIANSTPTFLARSFDHLTRYTSQLLSYYKAEISLTENYEPEPVDVFPGLLKQPFAGQTSEFPPNARKYLGMPKNYSYKSLQNSCNFLRKQLTNMTKIECNQNTEEKRVYLKVLSKTLFVKFKELEAELVKTI